MGLLVAKVPSANNGAGMLYSPPAGKKATVNVLMSNFDTSAGTVSLWLSNSTNLGALKDAERIETETPLQARGSLGNAAEKTNITVGDGQAIWFAGSSQKVSFAVHGYEEIA